MTDLIERLRAVKLEEVYDDDRMPDDQTHKCVLVDMRPDDFRALLREAADALEAALNDAERLRNEGASAVRWAPGSAYWSGVLMELFGPDARKGIDVLETRWRRELERAERLEKAVKAIQSKSSIDSATTPNPFTLIALLGEIHYIAGTALAKEDKA